MAPQRIYDPAMFLTRCTSCGYFIEPSDLLRMDAERVRCPQCGHDFIPETPRKRV